MPVPGRPVAAEGSFHSSPDSAAPPYVTTPHNAPANQPLMQPTGARVATRPATPSFWSNDRTLATEPRNMSVEAQESFSIPSYIDTEHSVAQDWTVASHRPAVDGTQSRSMSLGSQPSDSGSVNSHYPPALPSATAFTSQRATTGSRGHPNSIAAASGDLERAITRFRLERRRQDIYQFQELNTDAKLTMLFMHVLQVEETQATRSAEHTALTTRLSSIEKLCAQAWQPSKAQVKLMRGLIRHYLVQPLSTYNSIADHAKRYIKTNPEKFRLELYITDPVVRVTVNTHISDLISQLKSTFRKAVFASCKSRTSLDSFARNMVDNYHLPAIPADVPLSILGTLAMMRRIAEPLAKKTSKSRGGDTGFWRAVEAELDELYSTPGIGKDRDKDPKWIEWAERQVTDDHARFSTRRRGRQSRRGNEASTTQEDVPVSLEHENIGDHGSPAVPDSPGSSVHAPFDEDEEMSDGESAGLPQLNTFGDIASTISIA
ncbi:hypothetical protein NUW54_g10387 [Trametes sanguinea]|uniref:Uncharacterized protein n=1 Tax=Trametes sanguinea TaxID=158606 RepID=A0ACC1P237_9APHY|nr:hypothetical protein NUW54_g10387 [Trametes sanguinea]